MGDKAVSIALDLRGLGLTFVDGGSRVIALADLTIQVPASRIVAIIGPSGSGKTSLLNIIAGLQRPDAGRVRYRGIDVWSLSERERRNWRSQSVGFVFQTHYLFPALSVAENVAVPLSLLDLDRNTMRKRVDAALRLVGLAEHGARRPTRLSGGQQQLASVARAIAASPPLLLTDEPTGNLDRASADHLLEVLSLINRELKTTILIVTHDPQVAARAHDVVRLNKGRVHDHAEAA